jgi:TonB family protein
VAVSKPLRRTPRLLAVLCIISLPLFAQESARPTSSNQSPGTSTNPPPSGAAAPVPESPISGLIRSADQAARNRDYSTCAQLLEQVVAIDPNYKNALNYLGWTYNALGQYGKAEAALRKAILVDPGDPRAYNNLGQALVFQKKYDEAIAQYLKQIELNPKDQWASANLGRVYLLTKQYDKAISTLQDAAAISPQDASILFNLGRAYAKSNEPQKAVEAFEKSAQLQPIPLRWNSVAYELAVDKLDLQQAEKFAHSAIAAAVLQMRDTSLEHVTREDASMASRIASYWDTLGWIRFQQGDLAEAEKYVRSAWMIHSFSVDADHLGQIYEKQGRKTDAIRMYQMALAADNADTETRDRLAYLAGADAKIDAMIEEGRGLLKDARTIAVNNSHQAGGLAEFWILLSPGPTVRGVKFISGDDELAPFAKDLESTPYPNTFPEATELKLLRRGKLACIGSSPQCRLQLVSSQTVPTDDMAVTVPSVAGDVGRIRIGGNVQAARIRNKVPPVYPDAARQARIEGAVKLRAIIGKDGTITQLEVISGHPLLVQPALDAVRQWVYEPTLINGKPVEVDTEIDVFFQLNRRN